MKKVITWVRKKRRCERSRKILLLREEISNISVWQSILKKKIQNFVNEIIYENEDYYLKKKAMMKTKELCIFRKQGRKENSRPYHYCASNN